MRALTATLLALWTLSHLAASGCSEASSDSHAPGTIVVTVNPAQTQPISPYIYGVNIAATIDSLPTGLTLDRLGGNRWTAYNWETNASNAGSDWQYQNDASMHTSGSAGAAVWSLLKQDQANQMASIITVPMQGLVAGDVLGPVAVTNPPDRSRFKQVVFAKQRQSDAPFTLKPVTDDDYVYMDEFVWATDRTFAAQRLFSRAPAGPPVFVSLDNEPDLWHHTHLEIQGKTPISVDSYIAKTISLASALKQQFPELVIFGPAQSGFMGVYNWFGQVSATASGQNWFTDRYLAALKQASDAFGRPLVDVYDFHWYPEATDASGQRITGLMSPTLSADQVQAIVQSPRSLWDTHYQEKSWIAADVLGGPIAILDRIKSRLQTYDPRLKLAITEYNNGGGQHIAGTIAQADNLGIFADYGLYAAALWPLVAQEPYSLAGFRAYRDFDGAGHHFGDLAVAASSSDIASVSVHVSRDSSRPGRVVMVAINRSTDEQNTRITGQPLSGVAHLFQMTASSAAKQTTIRPVAIGTQPATGQSLTLTLPALSVTTIDVY